MANSDHLDRLQLGVSSWNHWRKADLGCPELQQADLSEAQLSGVNLQEANLQKIILVDAD